MHRLAAVQTPGVWVWGGGMRGAAHAAGPQQCFLLNLPRQQSKQGQQYVQCTTACQVPVLWCNSTPVIQRRLRHR